MGEQASGGGFFLGFLVGVAVGAVASLLMAPASGEDLRHQIGDKGLELKGQAQKVAEEARLQAQKVAEEARLQAIRAADEAKGQVEHISERGRIVLSENVKKAQNAVQDTQTRLSGNSTPT
jgi:gas vesicle protein